MAGKPTLKKRLKRRRLQVTGELMGLLFRAFRTTLRTEIRGAEWLDQSRPCVIAIWHGRLQPCLLSIARPGMVTMASRSSDGEIARRTARHLGIKAVRGSSGHGGVEALAELSRHIEGSEAWSGALTVDGPRGPAGQPKRGVIDLARRLQIPILPSTASGRPCLRLSTWDAAMIVLPFARVLAQVGPPIEVPPDADDDEVRAELKRRLDQATAALDQELHGRSLWPHG